LFPSLGQEVPVRGIVLIGEFVEIVLIVDIGFLRGYGFNKVVEVLPQIVCLV
jgi:hypothetical protein